MTLSEEAAANLKHEFLKMLEEDTDIRKQVKRLAKQAAQDWWDEDQRLDDTEIEYIRDRLDVPTTDDIDERVQEWWSGLDNSEIEECLDEEIKDNDMKMSNTMDKAVRTVVQSELSTLVEKAMTQQQQA